MSLGKSKLLETSATLVVTSALLLVTMVAINLNFNARPDGCCVTEDLAIYPDILGIRPGKEHLCQMTKE